MLFYSIAFVIVRTFVQFVCDDYDNNVEPCKKLLNKASAESIREIKSAYFLKVMQSDDKALAQTFEKFNIGFLASNTTYASEDEITQQACRMPEYVTEFLSWTAGVTPIVCIWVIFICWKHLRHLKCAKKKPINVVEIHEEIELTEPPKNMMSKPPLAVKIPRQLSVPRELTNMEDAYKSGGIRKRNKKKGPSVLDSVMSLSPNLKNRIMGEDLGV